MNGYAIAADIIVVVHALYASAIVAGLILFPIGGLVGWKWVRNFWLRTIHLLMILIVVGLTWSSTPCPLTIWEKVLREKAHQETYPGAFIGHWVHELLFYDAPTWVFTVLYTAVGLSIVLSFVVWPPRFPRVGKNALRR